MEILFNTFRQQLHQFSTTLCLSNLQIITHKLKIHENRIELSLNKHYWNILTLFVGNIVDGLTENSKSISNDNHIVIEIIAQLFRLLRNCCVNCSPNQTLILSNHDLFNDCGKLFKTICMVYLRGNRTANQQFDDQLIAAIKCGLQYYSNLLAKDIDCKTIISECEQKRKIWQLLEFDLFTQLLTFDDKDVPIMASAVFYNCVCDNELMDKSLTDAKLLPIIDALLQHIGDERSEWSLWSIERTLNINQFLSHVFANLCSKSKIILLDVIHESIKNESKNGEKNHLSESNVQYLVDVFKTSVYDVVSIDKSTGNYDLNVILAPKLLSILCELSANQRYVTQLQTDFELIGLLVDTLKSIHILGKTDNFSKFKPLRRLKLVTEDDIEAESPVFGFKKNVIRVIGNLSYDCSAMQDAVRDNEGIVVILDCCNIDASNPFIMEWSIFAIKNLMKHNAANQQLIYNLSKNGDMVSDELTNQLGINS